MIIKKEVIIGDCRLLLGDMLEIVPSLGGVDCAVSDPPYKLTSGGQRSNASIQMQGKFAHDKYNNDGKFIPCDVDWSDFMPPIFGALKDSAHAYVMANNRHVQNMLSSAEGAGFKFHNLLVWNKGTATPNRWYMKNLEYTGFFYKGKAFSINDCGSAQLHKIPNVLNAAHPTEKPPELMAVYIGNSTQRGEMVLDPFMGSGTTGVACAKLGRKFIGIELEPKYFEIACERIKKAYDQPDLFVEPPQKIVQEKLFDAEKGE